jgi:hypothetical protein
MIRQVGCTCYIKIIYGIRRRMEEISFEVRVLGMPGPCEHDKEIMM